jgi:hypothetical protein
VWVRGAFNNPKRRFPARAEMVKELLGDDQVESENMDALMLQLDESSDGEVSWEELLAVMKKMNA